MSTVPPQRHVEDDDSEDDPDFVLPAGESGSSESESEARDAKKQKQCPAETDGDRVRQQEARSKLWEDFQASLSIPPPRKQLDPQKKVKVVKKYRFAGEDVTKIEEVPEDSEDARKWPLWKAPADKLLPGSPVELDASPSPVASSSGTPQPEIQHAPKRPGPRRPKKSLDAMFATAKAKKLTTLDKSAMDWKEHVESSVDIKEDLEANRKGGGYLDRVEFLQRVEQRKEAEREQIGSKRRRG